MAWGPSERGGAREDAMLRLGQEDEINEFDLWADCIQPSARASVGRPGGHGATSPVTISSTSDNESISARRDVNRIKARLVRMAEHLRTSVEDDKAEC